MASALYKLAIPAVSLLIAFLAYTSQYLFYYIEPGPLNKDQLIRFNMLVGCLWVCYYRACATDPGRVSATEKDDYAGSGREVKMDQQQTAAQQQRWCRKCARPKPPRAHHCKSCARCIPRMDHHCPWTANCVSHHTYPHFVRFVFYCVVATGYLEYLLYVRGAVLWTDRDMPSYYGPSLLQLAHLFTLASANSIVLLMLTILLLRTLYQLALNMTTIESWEMERHEILVRRARSRGGFLDGPDGEQIRIRKQEFPYDVGVMRNIGWGMGSFNPLTWLWPLAATPPAGSGLDFEVNGIEDPNLPWPPPDPDRMMPSVRAWSRSERPFTFDGNSGGAGNGNDADDFYSVTAFRQRQAADWDRRRQRQHGRLADHESAGMDKSAAAKKGGGTRGMGNTNTGSLRRRVAPTNTAAAGTRSKGGEAKSEAPPMRNAYDDNGNGDDDGDGERWDGSGLGLEGDSEGERSDGGESDYTPSFTSSGSAGWANAEGERLRDFGVDEAAEGYGYRYEEEADGGRETGADDDVPLAALTGRSRQQRELAS